MQRIKAVCRKPRDVFQRNLKIPFKPVADHECQEEYQGHDSKEDGKPKPSVGKITVDPVGGLFPGGFVDKDLVYDFFYEIIFLIDDILLITAVYDIRKV